MMPTEPCARWMKIADRLAIGEEIDAADAAYLRRHPSACEACAAESRVFMQLEGLLAPEQATPSERAKPAAPRPGRFGLGTLAAAALLLAAAAALFLLRARAESVAPHAPPAPVARRASVPSSGVARAARSADAPSDPAAMVTLLEGSATLDAVHASAGAPLAAGATLATTAGRACLRVEPGVRMCLAEATRVRVEQIASPARVLRLLEGRVAVELEPQPAGVTFTIAAGAGSVTAIGTAFSVELSAGSELAVARVSHGVVVVRAAKEELRLHAHEAVRFGDAVRATPAPVSVPEEDADRALLREGLVPRSREPARLTLDSSPAGATVRLDGALVGATPLDMLVPPGAHTVAVEGAAEPVAVDLHPGEQFARAWRLAPDGASALRAARSTPDVAARATPAPRAHADEASALLAAAQGAGARGDAAAAERAYRALLAAHPTSAEAHAATLSLGELELARAVGAEALALFDRYLATGGPMTLEARYGRIRALDSLDRRDEATSAAASFLRDHPDSPQADALRSRAP